ncbi:MAG: polyhydroxyalkanoic acid system family protein [Acidobacteriota bacterium]
MSELSIEVPTSATSMAELKPRIDAALQKEFPGGMLQRRWEGEVLHLSGPGAKGSITFQEGTLFAQAELSPPASMMRGLIEQKIGSAIRNATAPDGTA